jgi:hypothetical protein
MDDRGQSVVLFLRPTTSFLISLVSWCPSVSLTLGDPFVASSAVADATSQAELGTSALGNGRPVQFSAKPFVSSKVVACTIIRESYSRYCFTDDTLLLLG